MKHWIVLLLFAIPLQAQVLRIGPGGYATLQDAARDARAGDTLMFLAGTHAGGSYVSNLGGPADKCIVITGPTEGEARIIGGGSAMQLSDPAYLRIEKMIFEGQTGNGVNIDDGGTYGTPAHHIAIEDCIFGDMNATGNNDLLKMSGVDDFIVRNCTFLNGSPGGSMIDMVGCHSGIFEDNNFSNGGSNSIQAKGGTSDILIARNQFLNGGARSINIGGSTGLQFFRPLSANYEAARISVHANLFRGGQAPFAYVGAVQCDVANNTVLYPDKWVIRILQETTEPQFLQCGDNTFRNNLVVVDNRAISPSVNIGGNARPETFIFSNNLWYNTAQPSWQGPALPSTETNGTYGVNPLLRDIASDDVFLLPGSPAIGAGAPVQGLVYDMLGQRYNVVPSVGAVEGNPPTSAAASLPSPSTMSVSVHPQPSWECAHIVADAPGARSDVALLYDLTGRLAASTDLYADGRGQLRGDIVTRYLPVGTYMITLAAQPSSRILLIVRR